MTKPILNKSEKQLLDLSLGKKPETEKEKKLAKQMKEIRDKGGIVEVPHD
ncbi:MAG TPA: hypothetical protein VGP43_02530 [Chitinophagaceae bacterium]|nr:hypothetical protein [Chitinophagaceae bacterium]